jgi:hypothetical protein
MRHARAEALDLLEPLIAELRTIGGFTERSRGVFYRKSQSFLHFHEDPEGLFADLRDGADFARYRVTTAAERRKLLAVVRRVL